MTTIVSRWRVALYLSLLSCLKRVFHSKNSFRGHWLSGFCRNSFLIGVSPAPVTLMFMFTFFALIHLFIYLSFKQCKWIKGHKHSLYSGRWQVRHLSNFFDVDVGFGIIYCRRPLLSYFYIIITAEHDVDIVFRVHHLIEVHATVFNRVFKSLRLIDFDEIDTRG